METFRILLLSCLLLACTFYPKPTGKPNKNLFGRLNIIFRCPRGRLCWFLWKHRWHIYVIKLESFQLAFFSVTRISFYSWTISLLALCLLPFKIIVVPINILRTSSCNSHFFIQTDYLRFFNLKKYRLWITFKRFKIY